jgi:hypothetical protein
LLGRQVPAQEGMLQPRCSYYLVGTLFGSRPCRATCPGLFSSTGQPAAWGRLRVIWDRCSGRLIDLGTHPRHGAAATQGAGMVRVGHESATSIERRE